MAFLLSSQSPLLYSTVGAALSLSYSNPVTPRLPNSPDPSYPPRRHISLSLLSPLLYSVSSHVRLPDCSFSGLNIRRRRNPPSHIPHDVSSGDAVTDEARRGPEQGEAMALEEGLLSSVTQVVERLEFAAAPPSSPPPALPLRSGHPLPTAVTHDGPLPGPRGGGPCHLHRECPRWQLHAFVFLMPVTTIVKLTTNLLGYALGLVRRAKEDVDDEYMQSLADLMVLRGCSQFTVVRLYLVAEVSRVGFADVDFGWGRAA